MNFNNKDLTKSTKKDCYVSIVIPAYNEEKRLDITLKKVIAYFSKKEYEIEIIVVDDGSKDATGEVVLKYIATYPNLRLIRNEKNKGKGYSVRKGAINSCGKFVFFSDADLSTPIEEIVKLLHCLEEGCDVAIGSRALPESKVIVKQTWHRKLMGRIFGFLVRLLVVNGIVDSQCGFKGFRRNIAQEIFSLQQIDGFSFDVEILFIARKKRFVIKEIPVQWINSEESTLNPFLDSASMFVELLRIRWNNFRNRYDE